MVLDRQQATSFIAKLRGGSQAHLLMAGKSAYVVKFVQNPQHRRTLINEVISSTLLSRLGIATPEIALVELDSQFLASNPQVFLQRANSREPVLSGLHFGSMWPGNPSRTPVYDCLPRRLEARVQNRGDFLGALLFDLWVGNIDRRQVVFTPNKVHWRALMIDHGLAFNGRHWEFVDSPCIRLYDNPSVYDTRILDLWLGRLNALPTHCTDNILSALPHSWIGPDKSLLQHLLERLWSRRSRVPDLARACLLQAGLLPTAVASCSLTTRLDALPSLQSERHAMLGLGR